MTVLESKVKKDCNLISYSFNKLGNILLLCKVCLK